ncbi:hypothetical protein J3R83DRAFT_3680 [Lanmaoa asiatica]|nr:hypothetical protein J3R83DRAFT_3680 [Lanmaoa asiatica]
MNLPQPRVIDHQKLKERLGSVVRSKEGKMVNVNAQFPFNLHNQDHPEGSSSRSSRNVSGGTLPNSRAPSPSPHRPLHKSPSTASLHPDGEDVPLYLPLVAHSSASILNVRLVKSARSTQSTRGRSQRSGDLNSRPQVVDSQLAPDDEHTPRAHLPAEEHSPTHVSPLSSLSCDRHEPCIPSPQKLPVETPLYPENFDIHDAGAVARSWGD